MLLPEVLLELVVIYYFKEISLLDYSDTSHALLPLKRDAKKLQAKVLAAIGPMGGNQSTICTIKTL